MDLSILVTVVLGFATCISPSLVAFVNNHHAHKLRQLELSEAQTIKKLELNNELKKQLISEEYSYKRKVYTNFINVAVQYMSDNRNPEIYNQMLFAYSECMMNDIDSSHLDGYMQYVKHFKYNLVLNEHALQQMPLALNSIIRDFRESLKDVSSSSDVLSTTNH